MMEETHFAGEQTDADLVYRLRNLALKVTPLPVLLDLICDVLMGNEFRTASYLKLSFGISIPLLKEFISELKQTEPVNTDQSPSIYNAVEDAIEKKKFIWSERLQPRK